MVQIPTPRFRLTTFFVFAFGFAVGFVCNQGFDSLPTIWKVQLPQTSIFYTGGSLLPAREISIHSPPPTVGEVCQKIGDMNNLADKIVKITRRTGGGGQYSLTANAATKLRDGDYLTVDPATGE